MIHRIGICGCFAYNGLLNGGQMIKTRIVTKELEELFGAKEIQTVDTMDWKQKPFKLLFKCFLLAKHSKNILLLPSGNGLKILIPLFVILKIFFKYKLHYIVIGGHLADHLDNTRFLLFFMRKVNFVYAETAAFANKLTSRGLKNVIYMPNFKRLALLEEKELQFKHDKPYKICFFARVIMEKGIEDIIQAVQKVNEELDETAYILDIYGPIGNEYQVRFQQIMEKVPSCIQYKGIIEFGQAVEALKDYFILSFPTYYQGEGFPGTLIDAFSAGVPIVATDWLYNSEIISENTGMIYDRDNPQALEKILMLLCENPQIILNMKKNCLHEAQKYLPETVMKILTENLA